MKTVLKKIVLALGVLAMVPSAVNAEDFKVSGKAEFVSDYIWRGADQNSGFSIQPSLTLGYKGLSLNVWGSQTLSKWEDGKGAKEFDINLSYSIKNFTVTVSDYWWLGTDMPYGHYKNSHYFEGTFGYCVSKKIPLTFTWSTMFAGGDKNEDGDLMASTYINVSYPIKLPAEIVLTPSVGFTPWEGMYWDKAAFTDISLKASKEINVSKTFLIPLFVQAIVAPVYDRTYLVAGFGIGF